MQPHEVRAQKAGFNRKAKLEKKPVEDIIYDYLEYRQKIDKLSDEQKSNLTKTLSEHKESKINPDLESGDIIRVIEIKDVGRPNKPERFGVYKVQSKGMPPIVLANESVAPWYEIVPYPEIGGLDSEYMKFNIEKYGRPDAKRIYWGDTWIYADTGSQ